jgi:electron transfer flavoprotein alpha subunit
MKALIYIETKDGSPIGASLELFAAAAAVDAQADGLLVGQGLDAAAEQAAKLAGEKIYTMTGPAEAEEEYLTEAISKAAKEAGYDLVLLAATSLGKVIAPRIAARLQAGSVNDAIALSFADGHIEAARPVFGGTAREVLAIAAYKAVISVRGGSYAIPEEVGSQAQVCPLDLTVDQDSLKTKILEVIEEASEVVNLEEAKVIVAGGRGMGSEEGFGLCKDLADLLGGVVGATRPAIENGWINRTHQVGQSGKIVNPDLYIACGISGATQHVSGMTGSKYIVAINKDEDAPIFSVADVGIVGDAKQILPLFIEAIKNKD